MSVVYATEEVVCDTDKIEYNNNRVCAVRPDNKYLTVDGKKCLDNCFNDAK